MRHFSSEDGDFVGWLVVVGKVSTAYNLILLWYLLAVQDGKRDDRSSISPL